MRLRPARPDDLPRLLALHVASWRANYRGILPDVFLARRVEAVLAARWTGARLAQDRVRLLEDEDGALAGFVVCEMRPSGPFVDNLHIAPERTGQGLGEALLGGLASELQAEGHDRLSLEVLAENHRARRFYARLGGVEGPERDAVLWDGTPVRECEVVWTSLDRLAEKPDAGTNAA